ncbi:MAG: hypothetical protein ACRC28_17655 [Clostridium sp.]|uniref:hypothetical protein n=1 Tax=Clostridium sp. TaxID=1506 RepID=UPI003F322169
MRNALKSLSKMKVITFLMVIQFSVGLYLINTANISKIEEEKLKYNLGRFFDFNDAMLIRVNTYSEGADLDTTKYTKALKVYDEIKKLREEGLIDEHYLYYGMGTNAAVEKLSDEGTLPEKYREMSREGLAKYGVEVMVDKNIYDKYNIKISEGRGFEDEDFIIEGKKENIPIIIGEEYKGILKIGDEASRVIPDLSSNESDAFQEIKFEVIGFYEEDDLLVLNDYNPISGMYMTNFGAIIPIVNDIAWIDTATLISQYGVFVTVENKAKIVEIEGRLNQVAKEEGFYIEKDSFEEEYNRGVKILSDRKNTSELLGGVIIILSIIGVSAIMVGRINSRKKEIIVKISCGAKLKKIILEMIIESIIICVMAFIVSQIFIFVNYGDYIGMEEIIKNLILTGIIVILVTIIPLMNLNNRSVLGLRRDV